MPDDRPVSPEERLREALADAADALAEADCIFFACPGADAPFEDMKTCRVCAASQTVREIANRPALSTPAGPSPLLTHFAPATEAPPQKELAAPSPREEAVEAAANELLIEIAIQDPQTWDRLREKAHRLRDALSAARPSSPTPEETPTVPERCPKSRQGDGKQCVRPTGHPGDCAASWASTTADFGHDDEEKVHQNNEDV